MLRILSFGTDRPLQTVRIQTRLIRIFTVCHSICIFWVIVYMVKPHCSNCRIITAIVWVPEGLGSLRYNSKHTKYTLYIYHSGFQRQSFRRLFYYTAAGVVPCGGGRTSPRTSPWCRLYFITFSFWYI